MRGREKDKGNSQAEGVLHSSTRIQDAAPAGGVYPAKCPWCTAKGKETIVGWTTVEGSSGICPDCSREMRREAGLED